MSIKQRINRDNKHIYLCTLSYNAYKNNMAVNYKRIKFSKKAAGNQKYNSVNMHFIFLNFNLYFFGFREDILFSCC